MSAKLEKADLFEFMLDRVRETARRAGLAEPQAFSRWFLGMYYLSPQDVFISDGSHDGKVDTFFTTNNGRAVTHHALNAKFTKEYNKLAPPKFYEEISYFWRAFDNRDARDGFLQKAVKQELRPHYRKLFSRYDDGAARLMFVTNCRCNDGYYEEIRNLPVQVIHGDELLEFIVDDIDGAMPRTPPITLNGVHGVLSPDKADTEVATSIVFARLIDFLRYMQDDPYDLLFMRNVRVPISLRRSAVNRTIRDTFSDNPREFAFSNNGITMLCEKQHYDPASKELRLDNPRVVNGSQTLHSIRDVPNPSQNARVMVRIIEIEPPKGNDLPDQVARKKDVITKIALRSNQQNPIKKWNLVSNDEYQMGLYRFFRQKNLYYERREGEWDLRSRQLGSVGITRGPSIKKLTQYTASYHWDKKGLGPAAARVGAGELFEGTPYDQIRKSSPELVYQLWLLRWYVEEACRDLAYSKVYIQNVKDFAKFALFALTCRAFEAAGAQFGNSKLTDVLENQDWSSYAVAWRKFCKANIDYILMFYKKEARAYLRTEKTDLTHANYFKNEKFVRKIMKAPVPQKIRRLARNTIQLK